MKRYKLEGVFTDGGNRLFTRTISGYKRWDPYHSKLAALILKGAKLPQLVTRDSTVLYLGAGTGATASYIADIATNGMVYCVEFSPRVFVDLLARCERRANMTPILEDANHPERYGYLGAVDVLYQDVAQRNQTDIFLKNLSLLRPGGVGILMIKARCIDVASRPRDIYRQVQTELARSGLTILGSIDLAPYEKDHLALTVSGDEQARVPTQVPE